MGLDYVPSTFNNSTAAGITAPKNVNTAIVIAICIIPFPSKCFSYYNVEQI